MLLGFLATNQTPKSYGDLWIRSVPCLLPQPSLQRPQCWGQEIAWKTWAPGKFSRGLRPRGKLALWDGHCYWQVGRGKERLLKGPRDALQELEMKENDQENREASTSLTTDNSENSQSWKDLTKGLTVIGQEMRTEMHWVPPAYLYSSEHEYFYRHIQTPPASANPHQMSVGRPRPPWEDHQSADTRPPSGQTGAQVRMTLG